MQRLFVKWAQGLLKDELLQRVYYICRHKVTDISIYIAAKCSTHCSRVSILSMLVELVRLTRDF